MAAHIISYLTTSLAKLPSLIGSNWGGIVFTLVLFGIGRLNAPDRPKWRWDVEAIFGTPVPGVPLWRRLPAISLVVAGWIGLFCLSAFLTLYDDHQNLVQASARIKRQLNQKVRAGEDQITALKISCANQQGKNESLDKQNRDEQRQCPGKIKPR